MQINRKSFNGKVPVFFRIQNDADLERRRLYTTLCTVQKNYSAKDNGAILEIS